MKQGGTGVASYCIVPMARAAKQRTQWTDRLFSTLYACPNCQLSLEEIEPRTFSFNSPYGACPAVRRSRAIGSSSIPELIVPDMTQVDRRRRDRAWRSQGRDQWSRDRRQETGDQESEGAG